MVVENLATGSILGGVWVGIHAIQHDSVCRGASSGAGGFCASRPSRAPRNARLQHCGFDAGNLPLPRF